VASLDWLKAGTSICLVAVRTRVLERKSVSVNAVPDGVQGLPNLLMQSTVTSPSAIEFPFMASCSSLILLKANMPLHPHRSVSSLRCLWVAYVAVALNKQAMPCRKSSGTPDSLNTPIAERPAASITEACAVAEMIGPYCVGKDKIGTGAFEAGLVTIRFWLNVYARYAPALRAGILRRLSARLPTASR
jgi:hypothetical protein